jgi:signal transduction histidine kinase/ligand-binding sensor domain-containing protein
MAKTAMTRLSRAGWLSALMLFVIFPVCVAGQYRFDSWTTDQGLPQNGVRSIVQTTDGYLWFTTFDGLVRFDGVRFTVFDQSNSTGIINNRFHLLFAGPENVLYAATEDGTVTEYRDGKFSSYSPDQVPGATIFQLDQNDASELLIKTDAGFFVLHEGQFQPVPPRNIDESGNRILADSGGSRWSLVGNSLENDRGGMKVSYPLGEIQIKGSGELRNVFQDGAGQMWIGDMGAIYCFHDGRTDRFSTEGILPAGVPTHNFWEGPDGSIWFVTGSTAIQGIGLMRFKDGKFSAFGKSEGLSNDRIWSVFQDRESNIWLATNKGINRLRREIITSYSMQQGLIYDETYPIINSISGDIVIGTARGLSRYRDGKFSNDLLAGPDKNFSNIQSLMEDKDGGLWMGVIGEALVRYRGSERKRFAVGRVANAIITDRRGDVWAGTDGAGLRRIRNYEIVATYNTKNSALPNDIIKVLFEDRAGRIWIGTYGGLAVLDETGGITVYTVKEGLGSDRVRSIYEDADGVMWIGTYDGGLSRFKDGKFFNFTTENGLFNNGVFATLEDGRGYLWMSCNKGIFRAAKQQLNDFADGRAAGYVSHSYGKEDGMLSTECNGGRQPSALRAPDGMLWFPTLEGVAVVDPGAVTINPLPPPVAIETVAVDRMTTPLNELTDGVTVRPSQTSLDIDYTGISFIRPEQVRFRYRMEGLDRDWIDAGTRRTANYSHLPPGEYRFVVTAANSDGVWNIEGRSLRVVVLAPFYRTWWFTLLAVLAALLVAYLAYRYRVAQLEKVNAAQEYYSQQLIESQENERRRIAVELHDSIGQSLVVIRNRALISLSTPGDQQRVLGQMEEISAAAADSIAEVRQIAQNLHPYQLEHLGLSTAIETMIAASADASPIDFQYEIDAADGLLDKEAEINLYRIVQEAINNILKHSEASEVRINLRHSEDILALSIRDNGRGFIIQAADRKRGLGLTGIAERAKMLGARHEIHSAPQEGTNIDLRIDLGAKSKKK